MKVKYEAKRINPTALGVIEKANAIIADYQAQGFELTLRQLYYIFVSKDIFPADRKYRRLPSGKWVKDTTNGTNNAEPNYKWLGDVISDGRMAGLIDWEAIIDRTRGVKENGHWTSPRSIINSAASSFAIDKWEGQSYRPEVWVEKDALVGVVARACEPLDVAYLSCRGYTSISEMWASAQRMLRHARQGQQPIIFHLGDHDPSGIDMSRDIQDRLATFGVDIEFKRIALNMDQVEEYQPPPNPAKTTDARFKGYQKEHGDESWELDALEPATLSALIEEHIRGVREEATWGEKVAEEEAHREGLQKAAAHWGKVVAFLETI